MARSLLTGNALEQHLRRVTSAAGLEVEVVTPQDRQAIAGDMRIHYLDWGEAPGPTILFLHGTGLTAHTWDVTCLALRSRFHCLAVDLRGHGDSEWSPEMDYSLAAHVSDLENLIKSLGLSRLVLVGMSLGGLVAMSYASLHSESIRGLVVVDASLKVRKRSRVRDFLAMKPELPTIEDFVDRALEFNRKRDPEFLRISLLHNLRQLPNGSYAWKYDHRHLGNLGADHIRDELDALPSHLPSIGCPAIVIRGAESDVLDADEAEEIAKPLPRGRVVTIGGAGHSIQGDNPRALVDAMLEFLNEIGVE